MTGKVNLGDINSREIRASIEGKPKGLEDVNL